MTKTLYSKSWEAVNGFDGLNRLNRFLIDLYLHFRHTYLRIGSRILLSLVSHNLTLFGSQFTTGNTSTIFDSNPSKLIFTFNEKRFLAIIWVKIKFNGFWLRDIAVKHILICYVKNDPKLRDVRKSDAITRFVVLSHHWLPDWILEYSISLFYIKGGEKCRQCQCQRLAVSSRLRCI